MREANPFWAGLGGLAVVAVVAWCLPGKPAERVVYAGTMLQLLGIVFVAIGFQERQRLFGLRPFGDVSAWFGRLATVARGGSLPGVTLSAGAGSIGIVGGHAHLIVVPRKDASHEDRIRALEQNLEGLRLGMDARFSEASTDARKTRALIDSERTERTAAVAALAARLETVAVGDLDFEMIGVIWLVVSTVATSIPEKVVALAYTVVRIG